MRIGQIVGQTVGTPARMADQWAGELLIEQVLKVRKNCEHHGMHGCLHNTIPSSGGFDSATTRYTESLRQVTTLKSTRRFHCP